MCKGPPGARGFYDDNNVWWTKNGMNNEPSSTGICVSLVGEECVASNTDHFKKVFFFLENSLELLLNSKIGFDFKVALTLNLHWNCFLLFYTRSSGISMCSHCP